MARSHCFCVLTWKSLFPVLPRIVPSVAVGWRKKITQNFSWSLESHHLEEGDRSWAKLSSMTICLEQEASLWLENWLIAWYLLSTHGGFGSQYIQTHQWFSFPTRDMMPQDVALSTFQNSSTWSHSYILSAIINKQTNKK